MDVSRNDHPATDRPGSGEPAGAPDAASPPSPGSPEAVRQGCLCSVLLNQATAALLGQGTDDRPSSPFVNPLCPVDHALAPGSGARSADGSA